MSERFLLLYSLRVASCRIAKLLHETYPADIRIQKLRYSRRNIKILLVENTHGSMTAQQLLLRLIYGL